MVEFRRIAFVKNVEREILMLDAGKVAKAKPTQSWLSNAIRRRLRAALPERFLEKIDGFSIYDCWTWTACISSKGYGKYFARGETVYAHRFAYTEAVGEIPEGLQIDHLCKNRACVNPLHLDVVTLQENVRRGDRWP